MKRVIFNKILSTLFDKRIQSKPLIVFEIANNHMGNVSHGIRIIHEFDTAAKQFDFHFAFKFQLRNLSTFIHPAYKKRMDIPLVKRFSETRLSDKDFLRLKEEVEKLGYISICTPFDEESVKKVVSYGFNIVKIASASATDWPLLESISKTSLPIILSVGGSATEDTDRIVSFLTNRKKKYALMHCVGQYPTPKEHLSLNQISFFQNRYPNTIIGYSTHESPDNTYAVIAAYAKGARIFEKHIGVETKKYKLNSYTISPDQCRAWLSALSEAVTVCGSEDRIIGSQEKKDLRKLQRGIAATEAIKKGETITPDMFYCAFPNEERQLLANDVSKYVRFMAKKDISKNEALTIQNVTMHNIREQVLDIVVRVSLVLKRSNIPLPPSAELEISHHYGIDSFNTYGCTILNIINRSYCKKLIVMLAGQEHPTQFHKRKEETFHILEGSFIVNLNGRKRTYKRGDVVTIKPRVQHSFSSFKGGVIEEISSTHFVDDSYYLDKRIMKNKFRKTFVTHWFNE